MIQRIQTLYMFLTAVIMGLMIFFPAGYIIAGGEEYGLRAFWLEPVGGGERIYTWGLGIIISAAALLPLVNIFLFKKRLIQYRLCMSEFALLLGAQIIALLFFYKLAAAFADQFEISATTLAVPMFFPAIALLLNWLALRGVKKDILLLKSLNRIR